MEPIRHQEPKNNFLKKVRALADKNKIVLVFDEVSSGFRLRVGGAHALFGVFPDIAVYAKALGNGYPIGAIVGRGEVMDAAQRSFISSTYWTERIGPAAALAVIKKMQAKKVPEYLEKIGAMIGAGWKDLAKKHALNLSFEGPNCLVGFSFNYDDKQELKTLFTQEMLKRHFLAGPSVYVSLSHTPALVKKYLRAVDEVFAIIGCALKSGNVKSFLDGSVSHSSFERLT